MAHPKRRQSKTRTAKRRTHDVAVAPTIAQCTNCGAWHVTVVGECRSPHMFDITRLLGRDETLARINAGVENIQMPADA